MEGLLRGFYVSLFAFIEWIISIGFNDLGGLGTTLSHIILNTHAHNQTSRAKRAICDAFGIYNLQMSTTVVCYVFIACVCVCVYA
jgi:hypothetical protein